MELRAIDSDGNPTEERHDPVLYVNVDGEAVITTPVSLQYYDDQITVRGAASIPNE
jgi:diacylglycerol kinase family enzyme